MAWQGLTADIAEMFAGLQSFDHQRAKDFYNYSIRVDNPLALQLTAAESTRGPRGHMAKEAADKGWEKRWSDPVALARWSKRKSEAAVQRAKNEAPEADDNIANLLRLGWSCKMIEKKCGHRRSRVLRVAAERGIEIKGRKS